MEPDLIQNSIIKDTYAVNDFGSNFKRLKITDNVKELQTVLRDKSTSRSDFVFYADRLIRLVVEEGLNQLPYKNTVVKTPTGDNYNGLVYEKGNCCVSIMRSESLKKKSTTLQLFKEDVKWVEGEAMEQGLRDCCRSIRIGKILVHTDEETHDAKVVYSKLPPDIARRKVLLMYPIMSTGNTVKKALEVLKENKVPEKNIILLNLFITPLAAEAIVDKFPDVTILTSEVHPIAPNHFGQKYFGTA